MTDLKCAIKAAWDSSTVFLRNKIVIFIHRRSVRFSELTGQKNGHLYHAISLNDYVS